jgi:capsular polysaccharide biosynthesis protein
MLKYTIYENATIVHPLRAEHHWAAVDAGVYDSACRFIEKSTSYHYLDEAVGNFGKHTIDWSGVKYVDDDVIFMGHSWEHYGHFLLESCARLWANESIAYRCS